MSFFWTKFHYSGTLDANLGAGVQFEIDPKVAYRISKLPDDCLKQMAASFAGKARTLAPVESGELKQGIKAYKAKAKYGGVRYWKVGTFTRPVLGDKRTRFGKDGDLLYKKSGKRVRASMRRGYGAPVEFGHFIRKANKMPTKWVPERPFLRPARVWVAQNIDMILRDMVQRPTQ